MAEELKACPFCGQSDFLIERLDNCSSVVICQGMVDEHSACLAQGPIAIQDDDGEEQPGRAAAIREWNTRAQLPSQGGEAVEVVGYRFFHVDHGYIFRRTHIYEGNPSLQAQSLMTVAQHQRIMAASVADPGAVAVQLGGLTGVSHQLGMLSLHFKNTDQLHAALRELRALLANSEGVKKP